jgi:hypothetical protein
MGDFLRLLVIVSALIALADPSSLGWWLAEVRVGYDAAYQAANEPTSFRATP